ncbi:UDP pyrophosphate phosphatase [Marinobacter sp.]|uniref:UDP pyrophosphate phosphatase n=1 Tax=Marinobacter sp. TaxID=50741 RepID=UPI0035674A7F
MIGGINPANSSYLPAGNHPARDRSDVARAPASSPQSPNAEAVRRDLGASQQPRDEALVLQPEAATDRRIEARRAAEDVRLERFRADELPLPAVRALSTFADVAAAGQDFENGPVISGIDIII